MSSQTHALLERFRAMETRILLMRYRAGGLLPEAEAALLEVLADRGCAADMLARTGTEEMNALQVTEFGGVRSLSKSGKWLSAIARRWFEGRAAAPALRTGNRIGVRAMWTRIVRISLLMLCGLSASLAGLVGVGGFLIANVFCDQGPLWKCFSGGLLVLGVGALVIMVLTPAMLALSSRTGRFARYLKVFPLIPLPVFAAAIHWYRVFPELCARAAVLSALMVLLSGMHLILSRRSLPPQLPEPGAGS